VFLTPFIPSQRGHYLHYIGLISQVAEELWEVKDKTIKNLTKDDITIVDYKMNLVKQSTSSKTAGFLESR